MTSSSSDPLTQITAARYTGAIPSRLLDDIESHVAEIGGPLERHEDGVTVTYPMATVNMWVGQDKLDVEVAAPTTLFAYQMRESVAYMLDHVFPETASMTWHGAQTTQDLPPNFHFATVQAVTQQSPNFVRLEMQCDGVDTLLEGGMHFSLLLPPEGRAAVWPRIGTRGRTVWPEGDDTLHRAVYTFVSLDPDAGRFAFDVYQHGDGRAAMWAGSVRPGAQVAIMGPGGGRLPPGDDLVLAGDDTALPAIRRILEQSAPDRTGDVLIELGDAADICDLPLPAGMSVTWLLRSEGQDLWQALMALPPRRGEGVFVWVAAEPELMRKAKKMFHNKWDLPATQGSFSAFWVG
ncbi:siderophore-interacting protein [Psychromarinibacter halotolerans]|uniref:Siderophore-interacting protein n=1 Tax=Psychromarinibacter halotolerans TaxID=1775175 RepID=A0ABV7GUC0_9RHOB|nr:siderophore-interacting protein [Psychromarinibacter halotolerans]MDF0598421.1 siderophore-interacting protein [Psychromarinibacter halotolerans]